MAINGTLLFPSTRRTVPTDELNPLLSRAVIREKRRDEVLQAGDIVWKLSQKPSETVGVNIHVDNPSSFLLVYSLLLLLLLYVPLRFLSIHNQAYLIPSSVPLIFNIT